MATLSFESVDDREDEPQRGLHRSRSGGYVDHLEEQHAWERTRQVQRMKRYHDNQRAGYSTSQNAPASDLLRVPITETSTRRNRSNSDVGKRPERSTQYNVQEVRPPPQPVYGYDLSSEPALPSQLPVRSEYRPRHQKKPSIKVQIHQDDLPPKPSPSTPSRSPSASPRSPTSQPLLLYQYSTLQSKFSQISATCTPYLKVEPADPRDLTFTKITEQVKSFSFDLRVWAHTVNLNSLAKIDAQKRNVVEAASRNLNRLLKTATELDEACADAKPEDLKVETMPEMDDEITYNDEDDEYDEAIESDFTSTPGFIIPSLLHSIEMSIGNLKRLTRSIQDASPDAMEEVMNVGALVKEVARYFGSQEDITRYNIDERFSGRKALDEAVGGTAVAW